MQEHIARDSKEEEDQEPMHWREEERERDQEPIAKGGKREGNQEPTAGDRRDQELIAGGRGRETELS